MGFHPHKKRLFAIHGFGVEEHGRHEGAHVEWKGAFTLMDLELIPGGSFQIFPRTSHPIPSVVTRWVADIAISGLNVAPSDKYTRFHTGFHTQPYNRRVQPILHQTSYTVSVAMYKPGFWVFALLSVSATAKKCSYSMIPVNISARQGVFDVSALQHNLDATTFNQNLTSIRSNFTETALTGYADVTGNYFISAQYCRPDNLKDANGVVQLLTHGIGFDKTSVHHIVATSEANSNS